MTEPKFVFVIIAGAIIAIFAGYVTWINVHLFLSRRDYYVNSEFSLFMKKLSMCLGVAGAIIFLTIMLAIVLTDKEKVHPNKNRKHKKASVDKSTTQFLRPSLAFFAKDPKGPC